MRGLTFRTMQKPALRNAAERRMDMLERKRREKVPVPYLNSHSPLRCFYYVKGARGKWFDAERVCTGMRWNWYLSRGRRTPFFTREAPEMPGVTKGRMESIRTRKEHSLPASERQDTGICEKVKGASIGTGTHEKIGKEACRPPAAIKTVTKIQTPAMTNARQTSQQVSDIPKEDIVVCAPVPKSESTTIRLPVLFFSQMNFESPAKETPSAQSAPARPVEAKGGRVGYQIPVPGIQVPARERVQDTSCSQAAPKARTQDITPAEEPGIGVPASAAPFVLLSLPNSGLFGLSGINTPCPSEHMEAMPAEVLPQQPSAAPAVKKGRNYGSARRRTFQLKQTVGAAALPDR